ncbi:hypothetical protein KIW84_011501 [Lathyrus oleraceus]|uniref:Uncharacterized protein n=1 Tax=Pisum sativum TaxID=3888 RepID=A0A9D5BF44_PEA|nr:hypothetical protein KIW84_011501 [Pisum sativum]
MQQQQFFEFSDPEANDTAVPAPTVVQNDVVNDGRPVRQRALPHRLQDYERFQDNEVNNNGDFVHFALMAESEPPQKTPSCRLTYTPQNPAGKPISGDLRSSNSGEPSKFETEAKRRPPEAVVLILLCMMGSCICPLETPARLLWTTSFFRHKLMIF